MCKAPKIPKPKEPKKPQFLRNKYLDEFVGDAQAVKSLKSGRSSLRIPLGGAAPTGGSTGGAGNGANVPPAGGDFRPGAIAPRSRRDEPRSQLR